MDANYRGVICYTKARCNHLHTKRWKGCIVQSMKKKSVQLIVLIKMALFQISRYKYPGRYIGENTRLVYDLMQYTEYNAILGLLLMIDFEKAFDSGSWKFIDKILQFFNFGSSFRN